MSIRTCLASAAGACLALAFAGASAEQLWQIKSGVASYDLPPQVYRDLNLVFKMRGNVNPQPDLPRAVGFTVSPGSDLSFSSKQGLFTGWRGGRVVTEGSFELSGPKGRILSNSLSIVFTGVPDSDENLEVRTASGMTVFSLSAIKVNFDHKGRTIVAGYADTKLTQKAADYIGRPELGGQMFGMVTFSAQTALIGGDPNEQALPPQPSNSGDTGNGDIFVTVLDMTMPSSSTRVGAYPNGTIGVGVGTTACNVTNITGDNARWYAPMDERHPVIAQNVYRISTVNGGTRFEQIGQGWVKHGFLSTNSNGCGTCQNPGTGSLLGVHCSDTYGSGLNASQTWLGPRKEVNPFTGRWKCTGSYFSNYQNDCVSRYSNAGLSPIDHLLQLKDADLQPASGTSFVYEAYYVSENDTDRYNSIAWKPTTPSWTGTRWNFTQGAQTQGPAINAWGDMRSTAQPQTEGDAILAEKVTDLGGGNFHYEYALYVHTLDRQIRQFTLPVPDGLNIQNIGFRDADYDATNEWTATYANNQITWQTQTYVQNPNANSLKWGTVYNFRFDANAPPVDNQAVLGLFKPGTLQTLTAATKAPANPLTLPATMNVNPGIVLSGALSDIFVSDDYYLTVRPGVVLSSSQPPVQVVLEGTSAIASPSSMTFRLEASANQANVGQTISLYNFTTGVYDQVDSRAASLTDTTVNAVATNPSRYVETGTNKVRAKISYQATGPIVTYPWNAKIDQSVWIIN